MIKTSTDNPATFRLRAALDLIEIVRRNPMVLEYLQSVHDAPEDEEYVNWLKDESTDEEGYNACDEYIN